jgi:glycosyltransferase involved in cell wall biosynthesis
MHDFSTGGSERIAIRLANQWARNGRQVTILCGTSEGPARARVAPEVMVRSVRPEIRRSIFSRHALGASMAEPVNALRPDLIFVPGNFHIPVAGALGRALGRNRPAFVCKLSNPLRQPGRSMLGQSLFAGLIRWQARPIDTFTAMSVRLQQEAISVLHRPMVRLIHEPNVDSDVRGSAGARLDTDDAPLIICAGRLTAQKNFGLAIRAFAMLDPRHNARLLILGEGEERAALEREVLRRGVAGKVTLGGHVEDIRPMLSRARLFLLSSRYEGYPAVLIEALAAGLPIVATDCSPAIREIMAHPSFGCVVAQDTAVLADAIADVLAAPPPATVPIEALLGRHRLDRSAQNYLDLFDWVVASRRIWHVMQTGAPCPA